MSEDIDLDETSFIACGVYFHKPSCALFVCLPCAHSTLGKLVRFTRIGDGVYESTNVSYFLNYFKSDDLKSIFLNRQNYDIMGWVGENFSLSSDGRFLKIGRKE